MLVTTTCAMVFGLTMPFSVLPRDPDEIALRVSGIETSDETLLKFIDAPERDEDVDQLVQKLGSQKFDERESASKKLIRLGSYCGPKLFAARQHNDAEIRRAAQRCLEQISKNDARMSLIQAAIRLLVKRNSSGTFAALLSKLGYVPPHSELESEIAFGIDEIVARNGKLIDELVGKFNDVQPNRRGISACIVASRGGAADREKVKVLLKDRIPVVRLRAAQGLLAVGDKAAIPVLIALLDEVRGPEAWQAQELLQWAADGAGPDRATWGSGDFAKKARADWESWWKKKSSAVDLHSAAHRVRSPLIFAILMPDNSGFQTRLFGGDGNMRWAGGAIVTRSTVGQFLANGRLLVYGVPYELENTDKASYYLMEIDWLGNVYWSHQLDDRWARLQLVEQLRDGRIHFVTRDEKSHGFLTSDGKVIEPSAIHHPVYPLMPRDKFSEKREIPISETITLRNGNRISFNASLQCLVETDCNGSRVWKSGRLTTSGVRMQLVFPLIQLGFNALNRCGRAGN